MNSFSSSKGPFIKLSDIDAGSIDIIEDAFGLVQMFPDVIAALSVAQPDPSEGVVENLLLRIKAGEGEWE